MSTHSHRTSRKFSNSPTLHSTPTTSTTTDDLHRTGAPTDKRTRCHPPPLPQQQQPSSPLSPQHQHITYSYRTRNSPYRSPTTRTSTSTRSPASSPLSTRKHSTTKMPHQPQTSHPDQPYYLFPSMQTLDPAREMELQLQQAQPWMMATTMIEDDDLTFGGKPLSTWYEEDRRRYSVGDESEPSPSFEEEEEEQRGRQRDRPHYQHHKSSHGHHKKSHHHHHHKSHHEEKKH